MRWSERALAGGSAACFGLAGLLALPELPVVTPMVGRVYTALGQEAPVEDPYRAVDVEAAELGALGARYLAAVDRANAATVGVYVAMGSGKWTNIQAACKIVLAEKRTSAQRLKNGSPEWPADLQKDIDAVVAGTEREVETSQRCLAAPSLDKFMAGSQDSPHDGAADRVRVRLGLSPRPAI